MSGVAATLFEVDDFLRANQVSYVIGGALALQHYSNPRSTMDIDLNIALSFDEANNLVDLFARAAYIAATPPDAWLPVAGVRLQKGDGPLIDLFFSYTDFHQRFFENAMTFPFISGHQQRTLTFLSPNDLVAVKVTFGRGKDWVDIEAILHAGVELDFSYIQETVVGWRGVTMYPRTAQLLQLMNSNKP